MGEVKKEEVKVEAKKVEETPKDTKMYLIADSYIYRDTNEKSQRTWLLKAKTELTTNPAEGDWMKVVARDGKQGYVKRTALEAGPKDQ